MASFDARCALTGLVIRSEPVVLLPLICSSASLGRIIGLPRRGEYDGTGALAATKKCPVFDAFSRSVVQRASFGGEKPPPEALMPRLLTAQEPPPKLGMRQLGFAYALASVYDALVAFGARNDGLEAKLQGKKRDAGALFELAMFEGKTSRILYELVPESAQGKLRILLLALVRSGLGHRDLPRATQADCATSPEEADAALARANSEWASIPEVQRALHSYASS